MADLDLTQTDAQVQSILNDGQNMQGAGAQTTLTTESVLLKDVNGNYHKILKSSFTEAIRDTLAGLLVNNDKGTTISQIAAIASGDFGSITPANLASVLGVPFKEWNPAQGESILNMPDMSAVSNPTAKGLIDLPAGMEQIDVTFCRLGDFIYGGRKFSGTTPKIYVNVYKYSWSGWYTFDLTKVE